jgi:hypothetical protein
MAEPQDSHAARNEALGVVRPLVASEETRSTNLNTRALGVISASSVITALAALFAKEVFTSATLERLGHSKTPALVLLIVALVVLVATVMYGVWTLLPRKRDYVSPNELSMWADPDSNAALNEVHIRQQALAELSKELKNLRTFNEEKVRRLKTTYFLYAIAVFVIALDATLFFGAAA